MLCILQSVNESQVPDTLLGRLIAGPSEFPPVCAIIGGILGQVASNLLFFINIILGAVHIPLYTLFMPTIYLIQEVIKAISGKGDPVKNFFFFDAVDGKGVIEDISSSA